MQRISDYRKIKTISSIIKKHQSSIEPNNLTIQKNVNDFPIALTQFFIDNNKLNSSLPAKNKQLVQSKRSDKDNIQIPDLSLPLTDMLNIYNIDTLDELINSINTLMYDKNTEHTIYRLVNIYTRIFFDDLKKSHNTLIKIFNIIFEKYNPSSEMLNGFLKKWFEKNDKNNFNLNICNDLKYYLSNKYE